MPDPRPEQDPPPLSPTFEIEVRVTPEEAARFLDLMAGPTTERRRPGAGEQWARWRAAAGRPTPGPGPAVPVIGTPRYEWCGDCKAFSIAAGHVVLLTDDGVMPVGRWAVCEVCGHTPAGGGPS